MRQNVTYIVDFSGFESEISQLWSFFILYSLSARSRNVTYMLRTFFRFYRVKKGSFGLILYLALYSAPNKNVTYLVDSVSGFKSENSQLWSFFNSYSIWHAAEMWLSYIFWFTKWKKSSSVILCFELYTACSKNRTYIAHFFRFRDWNSSSLINLYLVLDSAHAWIATNILS